MYEQRVRGGKSIILSLSYCQLLEAWANKLLYSTNGLPPCCLRKEKLLIVPRRVGCAARSPSSCCVRLSNAFVELVLPFTDLTLKLMWTMACLSLTFKINFFIALLCSTYSVLFCKSKQFCCKKKTTLSMGLPLNLTITKKSTFITEFQHDRHLVIN